MPKMYIVENTLLKKRYAIAASSDVEAKYIAANRTWDTKDFSVITSLSQEDYLKKEKEVNALYFTPKGKAVKH